MIFHKKCFGCSQFLGCICWPTVVGALLLLSTPLALQSFRRAWFLDFDRAVSDLSSSYNKVIFINVSMGALGVMGSSCDSFLSLLQDLSFDKATQRRIIMKTSNIAIRSTHYIFCQRNKPWNNPELLNF